MEFEVCHRAVSEESVCFPQIESIRTDFFVVFLNAFTVCASCILQFSAIVKKKMFFHIAVCPVFGLPRLMHTIPIDDGGVTGMG